MIDELGMFGSRPQHPVLDQELDIGDPARILLDIELRRIRLRQLAAHALAHLQHILAQAVATHRRA